MIATFRPNFSMYKWCAALEVFCWTKEGTNDINLPYTPETAYQICGEI